eukprot:scaffold29674_cov26-Tisochrysis_lutea.AAC.2
MARNSSPCSRRATGSAGRGELLPWLWLAEERPLPRPLLPPRPPTSKSTLRPELRATSPPLGEWIS